MQLPLNESGNVTLDQDGNGTVRMRPDEPATRWMPAVASVSCSSKTSEAECKIYIGPNPSERYFVDGTVNGSSGDSSDRVSGSVISRTQMPYIWAVWAGGDPGAEATLVLTGTKDQR